MNLFDRLPIRWKNKRTRLIVAGHLPSTLPLLPRPFEEIMRNSESSIGKEMSVVDHIEGLESSLESWSEYGAFWSGFPWRANSARVGLLHYSSMLDLEGQKQNYSVLPIAERNEFFVKQLESLGRIPRDFIVVSDPLIFDQSTWDQFVACGDQTRNLDLLFIETCKEFDLLVSGIDSETHLKSTNHLYSRNMFISPFSFAADWWVISRRLADFLDTRKPNNVDPRWAAYIIERLFSVYVDEVRSKKHMFVVQKPIVFFK
jgi:hypothetical protein